MGSIVDKQNLECNHSFCNKCIGTWVCTNESGSCPVCRHEISENRKNQFYNWGIKNYVIVHGVEHTLDLSSVSKEEMLEFLNKTDVLKWVYYTHEQMLTLYDFMDKDKSLLTIWRKICNSVSFQRVLLINESREPQDNYVLVYQFS